MPYLTFGMARHDKAWQGMARQGKAWQGMALPKHGPRKSKKEAHAGGRASL
jgi:hypothetical protein